MSGHTPTGRRYGSLPEGVSFVRETPRWSAEEVPPGLRRAHQVASGVWGLLRVYAGSVRFVDEATGAAQELSVGDEQVIPPATPHHVEPGAGSRMSVSFYR